MSSDHKSRLADFIQSTILTLPRWQKRLVLATVDFFLLCFAIWFAFSVRLGVLYMPDRWADLILLAAAPVLGVILLFQTRIYKLITRQFGPDQLSRIALTMLLSVAAWTLTIIFSDSRAIIPRSAIVIYFILAVTLVWSTRSGIASLLKWLDRSKAGDVSGEELSLAIYGVNDATHNFMKSITGNPEYRVQALICEDQSMLGQRMDGVKVYGLDYLKKRARDNNVKTLFITDPMTSPVQKSRLLSLCNEHKIEIRILPQVNAMMSGQVEIHQFKPLEIEDLLGRTPVAPQRSLLSVGNSILITGAGGSIGSELCRQVLNHRPENIVLLEHSELALYKIEQELHGLVSTPEFRNRQPNVIPEITAILGSANNKTVIRNVISEHGIDMIYHAAAYKHVPIVEANPHTGLRNNIWSTITVADAAAELGVNRFILVSTDKAVRPTNVMGVSKRIAEQYVQGMAASQGHNTIFSMVRFGNVLNSSGSVVKKFRDQIKLGGPVTVTHPEINRYFMTISEAASLVIQAGAMATGGEVFVLDMGQPVKIVDLAKSMIRLMGHTHRTEVEDGDIEIEFVGLRPGEKLYEELLIGGETTGTDHPKIMRTEEHFMPYDDITQELGKLEDIIETSGPLSNCVAQLERMVPEYSPAKGASNPQIEIATPIETPKVLH